MLGISDLLYGVVLPALIAGFVLLLGGRGTPLARQPRPFLGALAIGAGYLAAHVGLLGPMPVPTPDHQIGGKEWLGWLVLAAIVLAPIRSWGSASAPRSSIGHWTNLVYVGFFSVAVLRTTLSGALADASGLWVRLALTLVLYAVWNATERLAQRVEGAALPASLVVIGTGISVAALLSGSAAIAQLVGAACAGLGAAAVLGLADPAFRLPVGAVSIAMIVFAGGLANAALYDMPAASWVLLALAPAIPWLGQLPALKQPTPKKTAIVAAALTAVPAVIAVWIAYKASGTSADY